MSRPTTVCGLAVASMVLGIVWVFWLGSILAVIFAFIALRRIRNANGALTGKGMAIAGMVLGWTGVVTLIVVILLSLLGLSVARRQVQDRAAESNLRNAFVAVKTAYVDSQDYSSDVQNNMYASIEPSLMWTSSGPSTSQDMVSVSSPASDTILLAVRSASGECFYIKDDTGQTGATAEGTFFGKQPAPAGGCDATDNVAFTASW